MMKWFFTCFLTLTLFAAWADPILVGMHCQSNYLRCGISPVEGSYQVHGDDKVLFSVNKGQTADITAISGKVNIFFAGKNHSGFKKITWKTEDAAEFKAQPAGQKTSHRIYQG